MRACDAPLGHPDHSWSRDLAGGWALSRSSRQGLAKVILSNSVEGGTASRHAADPEKHVGKAAKYEQSEEMRAHGQPADRTKSRKAHAIPKIGVPTTGQSVA
ncbi:hypothetical protein BE61_52160 [Bradyrhizobium elkanii USDA 61]|jgi:hypothetical protein|nr:hypothetical protein XI02_24885 [Bradyrhizobium sp. CCBAU 21365]BBB99767.1 hypothetical protein BE61_52160 [Bradyrhizobium elkanii USDA 61]